MDAVQISFTIVIICDAAFVAAHTTTRFYKYHSAVEPLLKAQSQIKISQCSRTPAESTVSNQEKAILKRDMALILLLAHKPVVIFLFWPIATLLSLTKQIANCIKMIFFVTVDIYDNAHSKKTNKKKQQKKQLCNPNANFIL